MYILRAILGSALALTGILTALAGSILWLLHSELLTHVTLTRIEDQYFIKNFGPNVFIFLLCFGAIKAFIGIRTLFPKSKARGGLDLIISE